MLKKIKEFFDREQNLLIHIIASICVLILGIYFKVGLEEWFLLILVIILVISSELLNSAIELAVDTYTLKYNALAKVAKDSAAGAVLTSAFFALIIGISIFLPKIIILIKDNF